MVRKLISFNGEGAHYLHGFRAGNGRQIANNRVNQTLSVWTAPVSALAPTDVQHLCKRHYTAAEPRISTLQANAPRLYAGNAADYWRFPTLDDLDTFIDW